MMNQLALWRNFIIDMDGVLWKGESALPGLQEFFAYLRATDRRFVLATNNATRTEAQYVEKLAGMGVAIAAEEVLTSAAATAVYVAQLARAAGQNPSDWRLYIIGEDGLRGALLDAGFVLDAPFVQPDAVVIGLDRTVNWEKISYAARFVYQGARFFGTNADATLPKEEGIVAGNGAILASVAAASGVQPFVIGKPAPYLYQMAQERLGGTMHNTVALGDRLETDILGAERASLPSILVLTGITHAAQLVQSPIQPTLVLDDLVALTAALMQSDISEQRM